MMQTTNKNYNGAPVDLDTALSMTGHGKFYRHLGLVVGGNLAAGMIDNLGLSFALPAMGCELKLSAAEKGLYSGAMFLGMVLTTSVWGFTSDIFGRRKLLILSMGLSWLLSTGASLAPIFWLMTVLRFLSGAASSGTVSIIYAYMAEFLPPKNRAKYLSNSCIFLGIGYCISPGVAWLILPLTWSLDLGFHTVKSWRILCLLNGSYMLPVFLGMLGLPESPKYLISIDKHQEAVEVLKEVFSRNTGRPRSEYPVREIKKIIEDERTNKILNNEEFSVSIILNAIKDHLGLIFGRKYIFATSIGFAVLSWTFWSSRGFYLWLPDMQNRMVTYNTANPNARVTICGAMNTQLNKTSNATCQSDVDEGVYITFILIGFAYSIGYLLSGLLVNVTGKKPLLATLQLSGGLTSFGLLWATDQIWFTIFATFFVVQVGICLTLINSVLSDLYPTHVRGTAICVGLTLGRMVAGLSGIANGILFNYGCVPTIFGTAGITIGMGFLSLYIPKPSTTIT